MSGREFGGEKISYLISVMVAVSFVIGSIAIGLQYFVSLDQQRLRLTEISESQVRLIEVIVDLSARYKLYKTPEEFFTHDFGLAIEAHENYRWFSKTGELVLAKRDGDKIVFLHRRRHIDLETPAPVPVDSNFAEPMRRALQGESGSIVAMDYRGKKVLAVYKPVDWPGQSLGVVAKMDLSEIRAPFILAGLITTVCAIVIIGLGIYVYKRLTKPRAITNTGDVLRRGENGKANYWLLGVSVVLACELFFIDISLPLGVAGGVPYVTLFLLSLWSPTRFFIISMGILGTTLTMVGYFVSPEGGEMWMVITNRFLAMSAIWVAAILTLYHKESEQKAVETARNLSKSQQMSYTGSWKRNLVTGEIISSDELYRIFGFQPGEIEITTAAVANHIHPDDIDMVRQETVRAVAEVVTDDSGKPTYMVGNTQDITEIKDATESMKLSAIVFENAMEGIMVTDANGVIQYVNPSFTQITDFTAAEVIGQNMRILKSDRHEQEFYDVMWSELTENGQWQGDVWNRRKTGELYIIRQNIRARKDASGNTTQYVFVFQDITEMRRGKNEIKYQAYHDLLTGLPNRYLLNDRLKQSIARANRDKRRIAVLFVDVDDFKNVNDNYGHAAGDLLIQAVGGRLTTCIRDTDTVSRYAGDEFVIIMENVGNEHDVIFVVKKIIETLSEPCIYKGKNIISTVSIGIAAYPKDGESAEELVRNADLAMHHVKDVGKGNYGFFTKSLNDIVTERHELEYKMREAIEKNEFIVYYQPKVDLSTGKITSMEALVRWVSDGQITSPASFIPLAEDSGLIVPIGERVLLSACRQLKEWQGKGFDDLRVSVNISARQLDQGNLEKLINSTLGATNLAAQSLYIEVTETAIMKNLGVALASLADVRRMGVKISMDDFGTGYSSLGHLKKFPIDELKIDQVFVRNIPDDPEDSAIVSAIISMAQSLKLDVVAEGVETREQVEFLRSSGCDEIQGYYFSKPVPAPEMEKLLESGTTLETEYTTPARQDRA